MKAAELRIGNWVEETYSGESGKVDMVVLSIIERMSNHSYKPIPLTEEWLVRFGFVSDPYHDTYQKGFLILNCDKTRGKLELWPDNITGKVLYIKHVHTLQNLYHALTGEELELKP